jgi:hypothetical protein
LVDLAGRILTGTGAGIGAPAGWPASRRRRPPEPAGEIRSVEYWVKKGSKKGEVKLNLWRKRVSAPICATSLPHRHLVEV